MDKDTLFVRYCVYFRKNILKMTQLRLAMEIGKSREAVSKFECYENNSFEILLYYMKHGMTYDGFIEWVSKGGK